MTEIFGFVLCCFMACQLGLVNGHGYILNPSPRQVVHGWSPGNVQSLSSDGPAADKVSGHSLDGDIMERQQFMEGGLYGATTPISTYVEGQEIDIQVKITAHHWGWFEFRLCQPADGGVDYSIRTTQECLNQHVLKFNVDFTQNQYQDIMRDGVKSPADYYGTPSTYAIEHAKCEYIAKQANGQPGPQGSCCNNGGECSGTGPDENEHRWILPKMTSDGIYDMKYILPDGVICERCVLQWYYQTGNSIDGYPEAFWNLVDIEIVPGDSSTTKSPSVSKSPSQKNTASPTMISTKSPTAKPSTQSGTCDDGATFVKHPTDCTKFYQCANGVAYLKECQGGLYFNIDRMYCDWPENVDCSPSDPTETPTVSTKTPTESKAPTKKTN